MCVPTEVKTGDPIPVKLEPCLHPCVDIASFTYDHRYSCSGSDCDIILAQWFVASGSACPEDALSRFDRTGPGGENLSLRLPAALQEQLDRIAQDLGAERLG